MIYLQTEVAVEKPTAKRSSEKSDEWTMTRERSIGRNLNMVVGRKHERGGMGQFLPINLTLPLINYLLINDSKKV